MGLTTRQSAAMYHSLLRTRELDEESANALAAQTEPRVWKAVFESHHQDVPADTLAALRQSLVAAIHWALHIGQSDAAALRVADGGDDFEWRMALDELYLRAFIMFDTEGEELHPHIGSHWFGWRPMRGHPSLARLAELPVVERALSQATEAGVVQGNEESELAGMETSFRRDAVLYLALLEWLVVERGGGKRKVRDAFLHICALALRLSAHSILLQWAGEGIDPIGRRR